MAKDKDEKKPDDKDAKKGEAKAEISPEEAAAKSKKKKLLLLVVGGAVATAGIGGGLAFFLARGGDKMAAKAPIEGHEGAAAAADEHSAAAAEGHGEAKAEGGHDAKTAEGGHDAKAGEGHEAGKKSEAKADPKLAKLDGVDFGCTYPLQPFHLNLGNPLENRYVRLEVAVEYGCAEETKAEMDKRLPQLRDAIITVTSRKTREFLLGPDGKEQLRKEIQAQLNYHMHSKIEDVYLTDILIE